MSKKNLEQKIAIPCFNPGGLEGIVNTRFGRCECFTIISLNDNQIANIKVILNQGFNAMGGAGPMAAQTIANYGVKTVIGANYGPNAANALSRGNIETYGYPMGKSNLKVSDIIQMYVGNQLPKITGSNVMSHHGMQR
jgi:predicted Fe-Mo cluster-binding NifX family protein